MNHSSCFLSELSIFQKLFNSFEIIWIWWRLYLWWKLAIITEIQSYIERMYVLESQCSICTKMFRRVPHILSMSDGAKDCWRRKNTTNITMNISICTLLPFLFDLVLMHIRLHRGTSGKDRDMALDETENRTNEASDLSQKNYISLPILMCAFFFIKHTMVS